MSAFKVGSLFAGIGGIDLGFKNVGFEIAWANEIDIKSCNTYHKNLKHNIICDDIKNINSESLSKVDILTGGFPCQAFSIAGYKQGFNDERGAIFFELVRIVKQLSPRVVFLENVKNLKSHNEGKTLQYIIQTLEELGYLVTYRVLNTCEYSDLPQNRERVYMVAFRQQNDFAGFQFPDKEVTRKSIPSMLEHSVADLFYYENSKIYPLLKEAMTNRETCYQWRRHYVRENKNNLCPTLTANMGTGGHNVPLILDDKGIRKLTPRECARLQGFPDSFMFPDYGNTVLYKQLGNSVSVPVIEKIAKNILLALD